KDIKVKEQTYPITAEMVYNTNGFVEDTIAGIEKNAAASKGGLQDFKVTRGETFGTTPATLVTLTRVRGEKNDQFEDERDYLFRRNGALYQWTEKFDRTIAGAASSALSAARSAVTFTQKDESRQPKTWPDSGVKYTLPADFEYAKAEDSLIHVMTVVPVHNGSA